MTCLPRPVESLSGQPVVDLPPSPASFKAGSLYDNRPHSQSSITSQTMLLDHEEKGYLSTTNTGAPVNRELSYSRQAGAPPQWQRPLYLVGQSGGHGYSRSAGAHSAFSEAISRSQSPASFTTAVSGFPSTRSTTPYNAATRIDSPPERSPSLHNPFLDPAPRPGSANSVYSFSSQGSSLTVRPELDQRNHIWANTLPLPAGLPAPPQKALASGSVLSAGSTSSLFNGSKLTRHGSLSDQYALLDTYFSPDSPGGSEPPRNDLLQAPQTLPNRAHTNTPGAQSIHSVAASFHLQGTQPGRGAPNLSSPPPAALTQGAPHRLSAFLRMQGRSDDYNAPFGTRGPAVEVKRNVTMPNGYSQGRTANGGPPGPSGQATSRLGERRGSEGQALDYGQWKNLVMNAATGRS